MENNNLFRELNPAEEREFRQYIRDEYAANYTPGEPMKVERDIWHPVCVEECDEINQQAARADMALTRIRRDLRSSTREPSPELLTLLFSASRDKLNQFIDGGF
jgi:hypothetical protein